MRDIREIIIHCADTPEGRNNTVADITAWHKARGFRTIGYHFVIYLDGSIHKGRPIEEVGAHCKEGGHNRHSIGICYIGGRTADMKENKDTRTPAQKQALLRLLKELLSRFPRATIHGHREFTCKNNANGKCPGCAKMPDSPNCKYASKPCPSFNATREYLYLTSQQSNPPASASPKVTTSPAAPAGSSSASAPSPSNGAPRSASATSAETKSPSGSSQIPAAPWKSTASATAHTTPSASPSSASGSGSTPAPISGAAPAASPSSGSGSAETKSPSASSIKTTLFTALVLSASLLLTACRTTQRSLEEQTDSTVFQTTSTSALSLATNKFLQNLVLSIDSIVITTLPMLPVEEVADKAPDNQGQSASAQTVSQLSPRFTSLPSSTRNTNKSDGSPFSALTENALPRNPNSLAQSKTKVVVHGLRLKSTTADSSTVQSKVFNNNSRHSSYHSNVNAKEKKEPSMRWPLSLIAIAVIVIAALAWFIRKWMVSS